MASLGATIVEVDTGDSFEFFDAEFTVLLYEFKVQIAEYLAGLGNTSMRTLADLIDFNLKHCPEEMRFFGQEIFEHGRGHERRPDRSRLPGCTRALPAPDA